MSSWLYLCISVNLAGGLHDVSQFEASYVSLLYLRRVEKGVLMVMIRKSETATNNVKDVQID